MTHPNIESMRRYSETLTAGKAADVLPYFSGDLALHIPGHAASHVRWRVDRNGRALRSTAS